MVEYAWYQRTFHGVHGMATIASWAWTQPLADDDGVSMLTTTPVAPTRPKRPKRSQFVPLP